MSLRLATRSVDAQVDALTALCRGGFLDLFDGDQPPSADDPVLGRRVASLRLFDPAFAPAIGGVANAKPIQDDLSAEATGIARWFRIFERDHLTSVLDGSVGETDADLTLTPIAIQQHAKVSILRFSVTAPKEQG